MTTSRRRLFAYLAASVALLLVGFDVHAQTPTLTVSPQTGPAPLDVAVTWNVPNGTACQASGGWTGAKAASGTENVAGLTGSVAFTLACQIQGPPAPGLAALNWTAPTQNTNGTPLTDLAGFRLYQGTTNPPTTRVGEQIGATTTARNIGGLPPGVHWFGLTAVNAGGVESEMAVGSKTVPNTPTLTPWAATVEVTVLPPNRPRAPVLTVE